MADWCSSNCFESNDSLAQQMELLTQLAHNPLIELSSVKDLFQILNYQPISSGDAETEDTLARLAYPLYHDLGDQNDQQLDYSQQPIDDKNREIIQNLLLTPTPSYDCVNLDRRSSAIDAETSMRYDDYQSNDGVTSFASSAESDFTAESPPTTDLTQSKTPYGDDRVGVRNSRLPLVVTDMYDDTLDWTDTIRGSFGQCSSDRFGHEAKPSVGTRRITVQRRSRKMPDKDDAKKKKRREQNRKSARTHRQKKKEEYKGLQEKYDDTLAENEQLKCSLKDLEQRIGSLLRQLEPHQRHCHLTVGNYKFLHC